MNDRPLGPEDIVSRLDVSRETLDRLAALVELLARWQTRINLVGPKTLADPWRRHVLDSAQLWPLLPDGSRRLADFGSGAGFPGLVLAILGAADVHLVESDQRKAAFLREAARVTETPVTIHAVRADSLPPLAADVVTARALAPLSALLPLLHQHGTPQGVGLFPKGRAATSELTAAEAGWSMSVDRRPSLTDPDASLLVVRDLVPRQNA